MNKKESPPLPKLMTLNRGLNLAEQWVKNMSEELEGAVEIELEGRPSRLGLGAKVPRKPHVGSLNDPIERSLHKKLGLGKKKFKSVETFARSKNEVHVEDEDEHLDSRTNAFCKKRAKPLNETSQANKKQNQL